jgi:hypothetical protein
MVSEYVRTITGHNESILFYYENLSVWFFSLSNEISYWKMIWLNEFVFVRWSVLLTQSRRLVGEGQQDEDVRLGIDGAHVLLLFA